MQNWKKVLAIFVISLLMSFTALAQNNVTFQVNMSVQQSLGNFDPTSDDMVVVRGSFNGWSGNANSCTLIDSIYTCTASIPAGDIEYKFVIVPGGGGGDVWESVPNRTHTVVAGAQTIDPVYFNDLGWETTDVEVLFRVDMEVQILSGNFDPTTDWVVVRGGHEALGNWGGAIRLYQETGSDIYSDWIQFDAVGIGQSIEYKFVILEDGNPDLANWEQSDNRSFAPTGSEPDILPPPSGNGYGEIMPDVVYFSNIGPEDIITQDVMVNFHVDVRPAFGKLADPNAYIIDVQSGDTVTSIDEVDVAGFFNAWPWGGFGQEYMLNDNGIAPDVTAGDTIYAQGVQFYAGDPKLLIYKYGLNGYDVEAGFAMNHEVELDDSNPTFTISPPDIFGSPDTLYAPWTSVREIPDGRMTPDNFSLHQNYPNPFNPVTTIAFDLPIKSEISLKVFNITGEEVFSVNTGTLNAGFYSYDFNASDLASGIYIYRLETENFNAVKKMVLLK